MSAYLSERPLPHSLEKPELFKRGELSAGGDEGGRIVTAHVRREIAVALLALGLPQLDTAPTAI